MDSMHDSIASSIQLENEYLIITYNSLDKGVQDLNGLPYYKYKKLIIKYKFGSFCDAIFLCGENKYLFIDMLYDYNKFKKITNNCVFESYKYSVDSFKGIMLDLCIRKIKNDKYIKYKFFSLKVELDPIEIEYCWE